MYDQMKPVWLLNGSSVTNGATSTASFDTIGYNLAHLDVRMATADNSTNSPSVFKLSESDTTDATNYSDVTQFVGGGAGGWTIPAAITAATATVQNDYRFTIDLRARKRYIKLSISPRTTQVISAVVNLGRAENAPVTAAKAGIASLVEG